jgi:hypothetical protein
MEVPCVLKDHDLCLTHEDKAPQSFEMSGTTHPLTERHVTEDFEVVSCRL